MNQIDAFQKIIDLLHTGKINYEAIAVGLAKKDPVLFMELVGSKTNEGESPAILPSWALDVAYSIRGHNMVAAIKRVREQFGMALKEAKDICDSARWSAYVAGHFIPDYTLSQPAHSSLDAHAVSIVRTITDTLKAIAATAR